MRPRGIVGLPLWDYGQKNAMDIDYGAVDPDFYAKDLNSKLEKFHPYLVALEMQHEAHYQGEGNRPWSKLDLFNLLNFRGFLLNNKFWSIHARTQDVDIAEYENELQRAWSVREVCAAVDFAFQVNADAVTLHPGTYNLKAGRFWPKADEALQITNNRRVMFTSSLATIIEYFVTVAVKHERELERFQAKLPWVIAELRGLTHWLEINYSDERERFHSITEIMRIIDAHRIPVWMVRYCKNPEKGLHLALENVEPPNFLCCTPRQLTQWHRRMTEIYLDAADRHDLPQAARDRYRPRMVLDPNHFLNSKVILTQPSNRTISHIFEDDNDLFLPFVTLPCDMPMGQGGRITEPLLNRFVRENSREILYCHLAGSQKMDNYMTTHDPIKSFRGKMFIQLDGAGQPVWKYTMGSFDPEVELNLDEVLQVVGFDQTYILGIYDCAEELVVSSWIHTNEYLDYLYREYCQGCEDLRRAVEEFRSSGLEALATKEQTAQRVWNAGKAVVDLEDARFYIRPHRKARELWKVGYDEAAFYTHDDTWSQGESASPVDIFATIKDGTRRVWIRALENKA
jgi:hypothetical protein